MRKTQSPTNPLRLLLLLVLTDSLAFAAPPNTIELWPEGVPGPKPDASPEKIVDGRIINIHQPSLLVFPANREKATGAAIILSSGGGYVRIAVNPNGDASVRSLNGLGVSVLVLKYRMSDYGPPPLSRTCCGPSAPCVPGRRNSGFQATASASWVCRLAATYQAAPPPSGTTRMGKPALHWTR